MPANSVSTVTVVFTVHDPIRREVTTIANSITGGGSGCSSSLSNCTVSIPAALPPDRVAAAPALGSWGLVLLFGVLVEVARRAVRRAQAI